MLLRCGGVRGGVIHVGKEGRESGCKASVCTCKPARSSRGAEEGDDGASSEPYTLDEEEAEEGVSGATLAESDATSDPSPAVVSQEGVRPGDSDVGQSAVASRHCQSGVRAA